MTTLLALPTEMLDYIVSLLSLSELTSIVLVGRAVYRIAISRLYEIVDFTHCSSDGELTRNQIRCLHTLSSSDVLASYVKIFKLSSHYHFPSLNLWAKLHHSLINMRNLTSLALELSYSFGDLSLLFEEVSFRLSKLETTLPLTEGFITYLSENQRTITELSLRGFSGFERGLGGGLYTLLEPWLQNSSSDEASESISSIRLPSTFLPNLTTFRTMQSSMGLLRQLIPDRPIKSATLPLVHEQAVETLQLLAGAKGAQEEFSHLTLMIYNHDNPYRVLSEVARCLPMVESLQVVILLEAMTMPLLEASTPAFTIFKKLRFFTLLSGIPTRSADPVATDEEERIIARQWHKNCPTLQTIILPRGKVWFRKDGDVEGWDS